MPHYYYNAETQVLTVDGVLASDIPAIKAAADTLAALRDLASVTVPGRVFARTDLQAAHKAALAAIASATKE